MTKLNLLKIKSIFILPLIIPILFNATMFMILTILFILSWNGVTVEILLNIFMILKINKFQSGEQFKSCNKLFLVADILSKMEFFIEILNQQIF